MHLRIAVAERTSIPVSPCDALSSAGTGNRRLDHGYRRNCARARGNRRDWRRGRPGAARPRLARARAGAPAAAGPRRSRLAPRRRLSRRGRGCRGRRRAADRACGEPAGLSRLGSPCASYAGQHHCRSPRGRGVDPAAGNRLQLWSGRLSDDRRGRAAASRDQEGGHPCGDGGAARSGGRRRDAGPDRARRRLLRPSAGRQLVLAVYGEARTAAAVDHAARRARRRPHLGLSARRCGDDGPADRGRRAARLRAVPHGGALGPRRHGDG